MIELITLVIVPLHMSPRHERVIVLYVFLRTFLAIDKRSGFLMLTGTNNDLPYGI